MSMLASLSVPMLFCLVGALIFFSDKDLFSEFTDGCADGLRTAYRLFPTLLLLSVAIRMFSASGGMAFLCKILEPVCGFFRIPNELLPLLLMRPFSGSGSSALLTELFEKYSPDSLAGRIASVVMGSSDTILYTVSVYFSSVKTKRTGYVLPVAFGIMLLCIFYSCVITRIYFEILAP